LAGSVGRMPRPWRALHAELSDVAKQRWRPTVRRAHGPSRRKTLVTTIGGAAAVGQIPCRCATSDTVPVVRILRRCGCGGPGVYRAGRVSPPANSRFSYFLLSVRYLTKCGYEKLQNMANSILLAVETTLHPHGRLKCWCKVICSDLSQLLDAERIKLIGSQRIVQPRARASVEP
jgi:hypothetical protein